MSGVRKNIAVFILALPMIFMILHDIIPHHHHHQIHTIACSNNHHGDHHDFHNECCSDGESCDTNICQACQYESEYTFDNSYSRISAILPFILIQLEEPVDCIAEVDSDFFSKTYHGYSLNKFLRGPPSC